MINISLESIFQKMFKSAGHHLQFAISESAQFQKIDRMIR